MKEMTQEEYQRALSWLMNGTFFGYPICCIKEFVHELGQPTRQHFPDHPALGTGFVPCVKCAAESEADFKNWVHRNITINRMAPQPFPKTCNMTDADEWAVVNKLKATYPTNPLL